MTDNNETENMMTLQRRVRELDLALEQCQRGTLIPRISLVTIPTVIEASTRTTPQILKGYLEKFNPSGADQLLLELELYGANDPQEKREEFAQEVNKAAKQWPTELSRLTRLVESAFPGSAEKEVDFWKEYDRKLADAKEQLESPAVLLTKLILKRTNRVSEQLVREAETDLDKCTNIVDDSLKFLRDFPVVELLSSTDLHQLSRTVAFCLQHFLKLKHSNYDYGRSVRLLEAVGSAMHTRMLTLLKEKNIMHCTLADFRKAKEDVDKVFSSWQVRLFIHILIITYVFLFIINMICY